ncbi:acetyltransferase (GNAT) family protein [Anaerobacterium chartisolvens]|uniref:Acetyltransferase (GNAT) family protein n=1 Tax=Anaerobacterium chartisolvens TaxID=1297424 RepID=A0A369BEC5_9FIRM|nr:GNAT family N-acetyltransferase [Anaerobacterium chartisolvens]RCX18024.1 acetyltransferase (GNAT) family protein [Anaerobacterium chartisolvens]
MRYEYTDGSDTDFILLCNELDEFLNKLVGGEENRSQYIPYNRLDDIHNIVMVYDKSKPIGCASFKHYDTETAEVKRVFIKEEYRGKGISKKLMELLEQRAKKQGYKKFVLESGEPLIAAMILYRSTGYYEIPNFGDYKDMPDSICMEKVL